MDLLVLQAFSRALPELGEKLSELPSSRTADGRELEAMTPASWKQTAKDLPLAILVSGLGYGIGAMGAHYLGKRLADESKKQMLRRYLPLAMTAGGVAVPLVQSVVREKLRRRREAANEEKRVSP